MKRFYSHAETVAGPTGYAVFLDGRPVRTPRGAPLALPTPSLGDAVAAEWLAQQDRIDPRTMPLTALANAAIDVIGSERTVIVEQLSAYAETDSLVYRGDDTALARQQIAQWNPLLDWAEQRWGVQFTLTTGIVHVAQPPETVAALRGAVAALDDWHVAALAPLTTLGGSLIIALGVVDGAVDPLAGFSTVTLEERFQEERWGSDADALAARALREREWMAAARFAELLRG